MFFDEVACVVLGDLNFSQVVRLALQSGLDTRVPHKPRQMKHFDAPVDACFIEDEPCCDIVRLNEYILPTS